jgi:anti-sigma regulatory factor (Ser/Thr protein kinase)
MAEIEINIPATRRGITTALARIEEFCAARNLSANQAARALIIAEELITNTIKYGYRGECERPVRLRLCAGPALTMIYEDEAAPFDPIHWNPGEDAASARRQGREGRAGIDLVIGLSSSAAYEGLPEGNRLILTFAPAARDRD